MEKKDMKEFLMKEKCKNLVAADLVCGEIDNAINNFFGGLLDWSNNYYNKKRGCFVYFSQALREYKFEIGFGNDSSSFTDGEKKKLPKILEKVIENGPCIFKKIEKKIHIRSNMWIYYEFTVKNLDEKTLVKIKNNVDDILKKLLEETKK